MRCFRGPIYGRKVKLNYEGEGVILFIPFREKKKTEFRTTLLWLWTHHDKCKRFPSVFWRENNITNRMHNYSNASEFSLIETKNGSLITSLNRMILGCFKDLWFMISLCTCSSICKTKKKVHQLRTIPSAHVMITTEEKIHRQRNGVSK